MFSIHTSTGIISLAGTPDYESTTSYSLQVTATDGGGLDTTCIVTVSVNPLNEFTPNCDGVSD